MKKYRKKPIVIEAVQFKGNPFNFSNAFGEECVHLFEHDLRNHTLSIITLEGKMKAELGDYIVRGIEGELYPVKPSIFEASYEEVE